MNFRTEKSLVVSEQTNQNQDKKEQKIYQWDQEKYKLVKINIQIYFTQEQKIVYLKDNLILRIEQIYDTSKDIEILNNMEQIQFLYWSGQYGLKNKKQGKWMASWDGKVLINIGGYYRDGLKQGLWKELIKNYWSRATVFETGEYHNDLRIGKWNYGFQKNKIDGEFQNSDGGFYNRVGQKKGKWVELDEGFFILKKITHHGEYNKMGYKVGRWDIVFREKLIGGGQYDQEEYQKKIGKWIEIDEEFRDDKQITYIGEYNIKGMKIGRWEIIFKELQIGGGSYDQAGLKIGKWVELWEGFQYSAQVICNGEYNMNGLQIGRWDISYCDVDGDGKYQYLGGGSYDQKGLNKIGKWVELWGGFHNLAQVTYQGEYNIKGMKVGQWDIMYCEVRDGKYKKIGGGLYDQKEGQKKIGKWIELDEGFKDGRQITHNGEYNMIGKKVGAWIKMGTNYGKHIYEYLKYKK